MTRPTCRPARDDKKLGSCMEEDLEPDRIGRIGERQFEVLCERAGLYCNKSVVDVMGWDFIVEFPMTSAGRPPLSAAGPASTSLT